MGHSTTRKKDLKIQKKTSEEGGLASSYDKIIKAVPIQQGKRMVQMYHLSFSSFHEGSLVSGGVCPLEESSGRAVKRCRDLRFSRRAERLNITLIDLTQRALHICPR